MKWSCAGAVELGEPISSEHPEIRTWVHGFASRGDPRDKVVVDNECVEHT